jgi:hypothetical protein
MIKRIKEYKTFFEMANIRKGDLGLPCNIYASAGWNLKYGARIKVQNNYSDRFMANEMFTIVISTKEVIGDTGEITKRDIKIVCKFIDLNLNAFLKFWDGYLTDVEFKSILKSL